MNSPPAWCAHTTIPNWMIIYVPSTNHREALLPSRRVWKQRWRWQQHADKICDTWMISQPQHASQLHLPVWSSFWQKAQSRSPSFLVSLLAHYYECVFNDIQISTYITIIILRLEPHLRWVMPSVIVRVCVCVSQLLVDLHDNEPCCSLTVPWWGAVIIQLQGEEARN